MYYDYESSVPTPPSKSRLKYAKFAGIESIFDNGRLMIDDGLQLSTVGHRSFIIGQVVNFRLAYMTRQRIPHRLYPRGQMV